MTYQPIDGTFVIGLGHKARHGKDSAAKHLMTKYGAVKFSFANGLYSVARCCFNMTAKDPVLLQHLGTEVGRRHDDDRWIRNLYWQIKDENPAIAVIPDVRFHNEFEFVKQLGGMNIKVSRYNEDGTPFVAPDRSPTHPSETALDGRDDWDAHFMALTGQLPELYKSFDIFMHDMELLRRIRTEMGE